MPEGFAAIPPALLRRIVEGVLDIPTMASQAGRDAVVSALPPELATVVPRLATARLDTMSIVTTLARYPGGLVKLLEAIAFFDQGSSAMARLHAVLAEHLPANQQQRASVDRRRKTIL